MSRVAAKTGRRLRRASDRSVVATTLTLVGLAAAAATLFAIAQTRRLEAQVRRSVGEMLTSIRVMGDLESEIEKRRALVNYHIAAKRPEDMAAVDGDLEKIAARIASRVESHERWTSFTGDGGGWAEARRDLQLLDEPVTRALALSRVNRDDEARRVMDGAEPQFRRAEADLDQLIELNDRGASEGLASFSSIRHQLVLTLLGIGLAVVAGTFVVGLWAMGQITQREAEMRLNAQRLEARNREFDAFAGRVAHDIRGSLAAITLAMTPLAAKVSREDRAMQVLARGTRRMQALVDDLLALARVETTVQGRSDPAAVVAQVIEELGARAADVRVTVDHATVACSEGLLVQVVTNLIDNAVKYRRPGVPLDVHVSGETGGRGYELRVTDNGLGMTKTDAARVFEPFYRSPEAQNIPGTGLGLSIVSRIAEASSGALSVDTKLGAGSTFVFHVPLATPDEPGRPPA